MVNESKVLARVKVFVYLLWARGRGEKSLAQILFDLGGRRTEIHRQY